MNKGDDVSLEEFLFRRGYAKYVNQDGSATSRLFKLRPIDQGKLSTDDKGLSTPEKSISDSTKFNLFEISVFDVVSLELRAIYDPLLVTEDGINNMAHSYIWGVEEDDDILPGLLARKS